MKGNEYFDLQLDIKDKQNQKEYLEAIDKVYSEDSKSESKILEALPTSKAVSDFLINISSYAISVNATIENIEFPENAKKTDKITNFQTKLKINAAEVDPIIKVLGMLEYNRRIVDIMDINIAYDTTQKTTPYSANITLKAYYKSETTNETKK